MVKDVSRRFMVSALGSLLVSGPVLANAPVRSPRPMARGEDLARRAAGGPERLVGNAGLSGEVSIAVADVRTGRRLEHVRGDTTLPPASVTKALTALYALDRLGEDHRFETRLLATGPVEGGILRGELILSGGGDPSLDSDGLMDLAQMLKAAGVREVRGGFSVHDGALPYVRSIDPGQPDHVGYSPAVSGIALNYNRVHFEWKRNGGSYALSMDARTARLRPDVTMARMQLADRDLPVYTYADSKGREEWTVSRRALGKDGSRWLPVRRPAEYAGDVFRTLARAHGIDLPRPDIRRDLPGGELAVLARRESEPLRDILREMLKYSTNITAEMVGLAATAAGGAMPRSLQQSAGAMTEWARSRYGMTRSRLVDHSGLGGASRMSAFELVDALVEVRKSSVLRPLLKPVALRDDRGRTLPNHPIKVDAKTGTLNFASGLAGFMTAADGTELAFAIFTADTDMRARIARADREVPEGARAWNARSKKLQQALIERWGALYGS